MFKFSKAQNFLVIILWKILSIPPDPHPPFVFDRVVRCLLPPPPYRIKKDLFSYEHEPDIISMYVRPRTGV